jgi:hypothetical protein
MSDRQHLTDNTYAYVVSIKKGLDLSRTLRVAIPLQGDHQEIRAPDLVSVRHPIPVGVGAGFDDAVRQHADHYRGGAAGPARARAYFVAAFG